MATKVGICNGAAALLGAPSITSIDDTGSAVAKYCKQFYDRTVGYLLEQYRWTFARQEVTLAPVAGVTPLKYKYAYNAPSDLANVVCIWDAANNCQSDAPWERSGIYILCDLAVLPLIYTSKAVVEGQFTSAFELAAIYYLASLLAVPIKGEGLGLKLSADFMNKSALSAKDAETINANSQETDPGEAKSPWQEIFA